MQSRNFVSRGALNGRIAPSTPLSTDPISKIDSGSDRSGPADCVRKIAVRGAAIRHGAILRTQSAARTAVSTAIEERFAAGDLGENPRSIRRVIIPDRVRKIALTPYQVLFASQGDFAHPTRAFVLSKNVSCGHFDLRRRDEVVGSSLVTRLPLPGGSNTRQRGSLARGGALLE